MIKVKLIQEDKYGDKSVETAVDDLADAIVIAGKFDIADDCIEVIFRLPSRKPKEESNNDPV